MSFFDEPHGLWMIVHIMTPFLIVFLIPTIEICSLQIISPLIALIVIFLWESFEWILLIIYDGTYGAFFSDGVAESSLNVWLLDIGGGIMGVLLAMSFQYFKNWSKLNEKEGGFIKPFLPDSKGNLFWNIFFFLLLIAPGAAATAANAGWECSTWTLWMQCVNGYHTFPAGAPVMLVIYMLYTWWMEIPVYTHILLVLLFIPSFVPVDETSVRASFIQLIIVSASGVGLFTYCFVHRYRQRTSQTKYIDVPTSDESNESIDGYKIDFEPII
tara:strand:- start:80 stop:892 length:813 start_codon:yes stop_codon:yes gene_type:complete